MTEQEFFEKMATVWLHVDSLRSTVSTLVVEMAELEKLGFCNATIHFRSDNGGMELIHPTGSEYEHLNGRRREYIGKKSDLQAEARARVERWQKHRDLRIELKKTQNKISEIEHRIESLQMAALGKQTRLFSELGTAHELASKAAVPKDWNWLTPQMVIDYFDKSPILAGLVDDVKAALKPFLGAEWGQRGGAGRDQASPAIPKEEKLAA